MRAAWLRRLLLWITLNRVLSVEGQAKQETAEGIKFVKLGKDAKSAAPTVITAYRVKSEQDDYVTCRTWDGTTEGVVDVLVAKPFKCRGRATASVIYGNTWEYSYNLTAATADDPIIRTATATIDGQDYSIDEVVSPPYLWSATIYDGAGDVLDDLIWATQVYTGAFDADGQPIEWQDLNADGRAWATYG